MAQRDHVPEYAPGHEERLKPQKVTMKPISWRASGFRLTGLACLLGLALALVDLSGVWSHLSTLSSLTVVLMTALHVVIVLLASWRFAILARASGAAISRVEANRLTFSSTLANMLLPTSLAGDAGRVWLARRYGLTLGAAVRVGVLDRVIGLASLSAIVLLGAVAEPSIVPLPVVMAICILSVGGAVVTFARWGPSGDRENISTAMPTRRSATLSGSVGLSLAAHLVSVVIAFLFLTDQGVTIGIAQLLVLFPAVLLAASVPVSIGGWGTRELAAVGAFSTIGLAASTAVAMALVFGLTQVAASAIGTAFFLFIRRDERDI